MENKVLETYSRRNIIFDHGKGSFLYDENGKEYLDFVSGIAVNALGYSHPEINEIISSQAGSLLHCSNLYWNKPMLQLADNLVKKSRMGRVFFSNSGTEANEAALKLARKFGQKYKSEDAFEIVSFHGSFHGRTFGSMSITGQEKYRSGFGPVLDGVKFAELNNISSVEQLITDKTCAVIVEPIQGEGGIIPCSTQFLKELRSLCDKNNILLIFDEIQCGAGRLGTYFAFESFGVKPDIITMAKGLANGIPIGVTLIDEKFIEVLEKGEHASTFGGNPFACAVANKVFEIVCTNEFLNDVTRKSRLLCDELKKLQQDFPIISEIRGMGLMMGIVINEGIDKVIDIAQENGLLVITAGKNVIRFVPSLNIDEKELKLGIELLRKTFKQIIENV